jgi:ELWxxDGT repeat protein
MVGRVIASAVACRAAVVACAIACGLAFAAPAMGMGEPDLVRDINPGPSNSSISYMAPFDGRLYFSADDGTSGRELWSSDGTGSGTSLLADIFPGSESSFPIGMTDAFGELIFRADDGVHGTEPWASDGTAAGTAMATDVRPGAAGSSPTGLTLADGRTFFQADDGTTGNELWLYEGAPAETIPVKDVDPTPGSGGVQGGTMVALDDTVYFGGNDGTGLKLWKSDGTGVGTVPVSDDVFVDLKPLLAWDGKLFFAGLTVSDGTELWISDGTDAGTELVEDINPGPTGSLPTDMVDADGTILFAASDGTHGRELWKTDGTPAGTELVEDINPGSQASMVPSVAYFVAVGDTAYFAASDDAHGRELWGSDGTPGGTDMVEDVRPGEPSSFPAFLQRVDESVFFTAHDGAHGYELWRTEDDGTDAHMVADIVAGAEGSVPDNITQVGNDLFFVAGTAAAGRELWGLQLDVAPTAVDDSDSVAEDSPATAVEVLANDIDSDDGPKAVASVTQPSHGEVVVTGGGTGLTYEPDPGYCNGGGATDDFTYGLAPGGDAATVEMTVTCVDDPPVAVDDAATVAQGAAATAIPVLANDADFDGGAPKAVGSVTQPLHGEVAVTGSGLTYRPDAGYCNRGGATDDFTYGLAPGGDTATVALTVTCAPAQPPLPEGGDGPDERSGIAVAARAAKVERGIARLRLRCRGVGACTGRVTLAVTRRGKLGGRVLLGAKRFAIPAGKAKTLRIRLNRAGRSRLTKRPSGRLRVRLAGSGVKPRRVVLKKAGSAPRSVRQRPRR